MTDRELYAIVGNQVAELLGEIVAEQLRPGNARSITARLVETAIGPRNGPDCGGRLIVDPQFGVGEKALRPLLGGGALSCPYVSIDRLAQVRGRSLVDRRELLQN